MPLKSAYLFKEEKFEALGLTNPLDLMFVKSLCHLKKCPLILIYSYEDYHHFPHSLIVQIGNESRVFADHMMCMNDSLFFFEI